MKFSFPRIRGAAGWLALIGTFGIPWSSSAASAASPAEIGSAIEVIQRVGREGAGHRAARDAWQVLNQATADQLPELLAGFDDRSALADNWLRAAVDAVAERTLAAGGPLPLDRMEKFILDHGHSPRARRLAFEWLTRVDAEAEDRLIPGMVDDPSLELRRDAVARLLQAADTLAESSQSEPAQEQYQAALRSARDSDQVDAAVAGLEKLKVVVDLQRHYGFITDWRLIGPFDNRGKSGFDNGYPPESELQTTATYPGKEGELEWIAHHTDDKFGFVDFNLALGKHMGAVGYAYAEFYSDAARTVDIRLGCINANKVWVNGQLLIANHVYHAGTAIDQYVARAELQPGLNTILVKCCQNEQTDAWAQDWKFQLRVCDSIGTPIFSQKP